MWMSSYKPRKPKTRKRWWWSRPCRPETWARRRRSRRCTPGGSGYRRTAEWECRYPESWNNTNPADWRVYRLNMTSEWGERETHVLIVNRLALISCSLSLSISSSLRLFCWALSERTLVLVPLLPVNTHPETNGVFETKRDACQPSEMQTGTEDKSWTHAPHGEMFIYMLFCSYFTCFITSLLKKSTEHVMVLMGIALVLMGIIMVSTGMWWTLLVGC